MADSRTLDRAINFIGASIAALGAAAAVIAAMFEPAKTLAFLSSGVRLPIWALMVGLLLAIAIVYFIYRLVLDRADQIDTLTKSLTTQEGVLKELIDTRRIDVITGIPNQDKLKIDIEQLSPHIGLNNPYHIVMIDLNNFREINRRFSYAKGDDVIRYLALSIFNSLRRSESAYRQTLDDLTARQLLTRVYRKYPGGDEFIFLLQGEEQAALGFLNRLQGDFEKTYNAGVSKIVDADWTFTFDAGVFPLNRGVTYKEAFAGVEGLLRLGSNDGSRSRVHWFSRKTSADFADQKIALTYGEAERRFATTPPRSAGPDQPL